MGPMCELAICNLARPLQWACEVAICKFAHGCLLGGLPVCSPSSACIRSQHTSFTRPPSRFSSRIGPCVSLPTSLICSVARPPVPKCLRTEAVLHKLLRQSRLCIYKQCLVSGSLPGLRPHMAMSHNKKGRKHYSQRLTAPIVICWRISRSECSCTK